MNAVLMFSLVWAFTAVCQASDDVCRITCDDVTETVRTKVSFNCSVSQNCSECCVRKYKFQYPDKVNDSEICRQDHKDSCDQTNTFTCSFTPPTAMEGQFRFFLQTDCGLELAEFTVNITVGDPRSTETVSPKDAISSAVISSIIIIFIILIIILMAIYFKKHSTKVRAKMIQGIIHVEEN